MGGGNGLDHNCCVCVCVCHFEGTSKQIDFEGFCFHSKLSLHLCLNIQNGNADILASSDTRFPAISSKPHVLPHHVPST